MAMETAIQTPAQLRKARRQYQLMQRALQQAAVASKKGRVPRHWRWILGIGPSNMLARLRHDIAVYEWRKQKQKDLRQAKKHGTPGSRKNRGGQIS